MNEKNDKLLVIEKVVRSYYEKRQDVDGTWDWYLVKQIVPFENEWMEDKKYA